MRSCSILHNVNQIVVQSGLENAYINFSRQLNAYLQERYSRYYIGLQLYQSQENPGMFFVIADYKDRFGIKTAAKIIGEDISKIYDDTWGDSVQRSSIISFLNYNRIIPK